MRPALAPAMSTNVALSAFALFTLLTTFPLGLTTPQRNKQLHLICKEPGSFECSLWSTKLEDTLNELYISKDLTRNCGFSDLEPVPPHRRFIKVRPLNKSSKIIFCKLSNIVIIKVIDSNPLKKSINGIYRIRRQVGYTPRGRYRGQTQSQYLTIDHGNGEDEGKAEAQSSADTSRAVVSGKSGMGQAQSQTIYDPSCDECIGGSSPGAESLKQRPNEPQNRPNLSGSVETQRTPGTDGTPGTYGTQNSPGTTGNLGPHNGLGSMGNYGSPGSDSSFWPQSPGSIGNYRPQDRTSGGGSVGPQSSLGNIGNYIPRGALGGTTSVGTPNGPSGTGIYGTQGTPNGNSNLGPLSGTGGVGIYGPQDVSRGDGNLGSQNRPHSISGYIPQDTSGGSRSLEPQNGPNGIGNYGLTGNLANNLGDKGGISSEPYKPQGIVNGDRNYGSQISPSRRTIYIPQADLGGSSIYVPQTITGIPSYGPQIRLDDRAIYGQGSPSGTYKPQSTGTYETQEIPRSNVIYNPQSGITDSNNNGLPNAIADYKPQGNIGTNPTYYCCVVGPNNSLQYVGPGNIKSPEVVRQIPFANGGQQPNLLYQYGPGLPSSYNTGTLTGQTPSVTYGIQPGQSPTDLYGAGIISGQMPNSQGTGTVNRQPSGFYGGGTTGGEIPVARTYGPKSITGQSDGSYSPGPISGQTSNIPYNIGITNGQTSTGPFGTGIPGTLKPAGVYGSGTINGQPPTGVYTTGGVQGQSPIVPYGTGNAAGTTVISNEQAPPNPYGTVSNGGQIPNNLYSTGNLGPTAGGPFNTDSVGGQIPNGSYGGGNTNNPIPTGPYGQRAIGPYGTGNIPYGTNIPETNNGQIPAGTYGNNAGNKLYGREPGITFNSGQNIQGPYDARERDSSNGQHDSKGNTIGNDYNGVPQNVIDPNSILIDGDDSEALANVDQNANGTTASASSKGGHDKGRAQTQVQGTYTGSGSFSAQAQINEENKGAESEVKGGKEGASSKAQGRGRNNQAQAGVRLGSATGAIETEAQSSGSAHSSNSNVQGSVKGGMADAQAKGPGSTSSQAQIGFSPYKDTDKVRHDSFKIPFVGKGTASAQSSGRTGQSQSQLEGTFKYGITYNGAAQAGSSLDKDTVFTNRLPFNKIDVFDENNKNINIDTEKPVDMTTLPEIPLDTNIVNETHEGETLKKSESRYSSHSHSDHHKINNEQYTTENPSTIASKRSFQPTYNTNTADYEYTTDKDINPPEDYDGDGSFGTEDATEVEQGEYSNYDEFSRDHETHQSLRNPSRKGLEVKQTTGSNTQHIVLGSLYGHDAEITQKNSEQGPDERKVYQPGESVPGIGGYTIPIGFTGSVKSVASKDRTFATGFKDSPSQAQTVTLTPGTGKVKYVYPRPTYSQGKIVKPKDLRSLYNSKADDNNRYVSVSKSVTGALDSNNNIQKQYSHTYYTKSSSCGYFTFTCTMVSGSNGRKKVCKPKIPTNPDGTPLRC